MENYKKLTNEVGAPIADNENSITAGPRGPVVMQDVWLMEKMAHFNREVIPERRMHAKGWGAYGTFTVTHDISRYTSPEKKQKFLSGSPRLPASAAQPTVSAIFEALQLSSIRKKETGI